MVTHSFDLNSVRNPGSNKAFREIYRLDLRRPFGTYMGDVFWTSGYAYIRRNTVSDVSRYGFQIAEVGYDYGSTGFTFTFEDNIIFNCGDSDVYSEVLFSATTGTVTFRGNSFLNNGTGLYIEGMNEFEESTLTIEDNNFVNNDEYGLYNNDSDLIDATNNWWGDETGPYDAKALPATPNYNNPIGLGNGVSANVDYGPWLEAAYVADGDGSGTGCAVGEFSPAILLLVLPLAGLFRKK